MHVYNLHETQDSQHEYNMYACMQMKSLYVPRNRMVLSVYSSTRPSLNVYVCGVYIHTSIYNYTCMYYMLMCCYVLPASVYTCIMLLYLCYGSDICAHVFVCIYECIARHTTLWDAETAPLTSVMQIWPLDPRSQITTNRIESRVHVR